MRKIPRTAKLDEAVGRVQFGSPRNFLNPIISKFDKHVVLLPLLPIGGFQPISRDTDDNGEMYKCWWTNKRG